MNLTHLHLILNHFPIVGLMVSVLLLGWALLRKNKELLSAASFIIALMAISGMAVMYTGDAAEETVENLQGISTIALKAHEEAAETSIWILVASGFLGVIALIWKNLLNKISISPFVVTFIVGCIAFGAMAYTGYQGGKIRHSELVNATTSVRNAENLQEVVNNGKKEEKEED